MEKHTPGPWRVIDSNKGRKFNKISIRANNMEDGRVVVVASVYPIMLNGDGCANARLIAAAPDLLEALQYAIGQVPELATVPGIAATMEKVFGA